jgi:hypothetical protein
MKAGTGIKVSKRTPVDSSTGPDEELLVRTGERDKVSFEIFYDR